MRYRRFYQGGSTYFFTVVTHQRRPLLTAPKHVDLLRQAFKAVMVDRPFSLDAMVVLPDHLHCLWTLPANDADYSTRWRLVKSFFSRRCTGVDQPDPPPGRRYKREKPVWQRRFWEHWIRDQADFDRHLDYIHYNPVHHGHVTAPRLWPHSSFARYVAAGAYAEDWGADVVIRFEDATGYE